MTALHPMLPDRCGAPVWHDGDLYRIRTQSAGFSTGGMPMVALGYPAEVNGTGLSFWPPVKTVPATECLSQLKLARQLGHPA